MGSHGEGISLLLAVSYFLVKSCLAMQHDTHQACVSVNVQRSSGIGTRTHGPGQSAAGGSKQL